MADSQVDDLHMVGELVKQKAVVVFITFIVSAYVTSHVRYVRHTSLLRFTCIERANMLQAA